MKLKGIFASSGIKSAYKTLSKVNKEEPYLSNLTDEELRAHFDMMREDAKGQLSGAKREALKVSVFAVCREVSKRVLGKRHYDVQILGGLALSDGMIAEMKTGEGKTIASIPPAVFNSILGHSVHIVTVNDYLAKRDCDILSPVYTFLGMSCGALQNHMSNSDRQIIYSCDITYGTSTEFAFDYLRDNMANHKSEIIQRDHGFTIIDEADSVLIDEAQMPLIVSNPGVVDDDLINKVQTIAKDMNVYFTDSQRDIEDTDIHDNFHAIAYEKGKRVQLTDYGHNLVEDQLISMGLVDSKDNVYSANNLFLVSLVSQSIKAKYLYQKNVDYIVSPDNQVQIIDIRTGRIQPSRRWSEGLHQAIECKEGVEVNPENEAAASISLQNYFRMYEVLSGMTGTGSESEFREVYGMKTMVIPTNLPMIRKDANDIVYMSEKAKYNAIVNEIKSIHAASRPILVGTSSVSESVFISKRLEEEGVPHSVINAKNHESESKIVASAGRLSAVTIATNMAGRGTDILLGGTPPSPEDGADQKDKFLKERSFILESGGLHVIGTTRQSSRRVDEQLIGRAGRQGEPGSSVFYVSLEDELLRHFGGEKHIKMFKSLGFEENDFITHKILGKVIKEAQQKIEEQNYSSRKEMIKYDDINSIQMAHIYKVRRDWLESSDADALKWATEAIDTQLTAVLLKHIPKGVIPEQINAKDLANDLSIQLPSLFSEQEVRDLLSDSVFDEAAIFDSFLSLLRQKYETLMNEMGDHAGDAALSSLFRSIVTTIISLYWTEHLETLDQLRQGINLRSYAQAKPIEAYSKDSFRLFSTLIEDISAHSVKSIIKSMQITLHSIQQENPQTKQVA